MMYKRLIIYMLLFVAAICPSCKTSDKLILEKECRTLVSKLEINDKDINMWLANNTAECTKMMKFIEDENSTQKVKDYCKNIIDIKMSDDQFKIERLIEFYYLFESSDDPFELERKIKSKNRN